jgi:pilus assembly protein CpaF
MTWFEQEAVAFDPIRFQFNSMSFEIILPFLRPIEALISDEEITEIMCNPDSSCWIEKRGLISPAPNVHFQSGELHAGLEVIANKFGKQLTADSPILNARLPDGSYSPQA